MNNSSNLMPNDAQDNVTVFCCNMIKKKLRKRKTDVRAYAGSKYIEKNNFRFNFKSLHFKILISSKTCK